MVAVQPFEHEEAVDVDHFVVLHDATWADFQRLLEVRGDRSVPRLCFFQGELQIMSPSRTHESIASAIGLLVATYCDASSPRAAAVQLKEKPGAAKTFANGVRRLDRSQLVFLGTSNPKLWNWVKVEKTDATRAEVAALLIDELSVGDQRQWGLSMATRKPMPTRSLGLCAM